MMVCDRSDDFIAKPGGVTRFVTIRWRFGLLCVLGIVLLGRAPTTMAAAADQEPCPNESLRAALNSTALPDCRAYELVTPPYKEGYPLFVQSLAADGESAILFSLASLTGNPGSSEQLIVSGIYSATRTSAGWRLTAMNAPLSQFVGQIPVLAAEEADRGDTLWEQHEPDQPLSNVGLYARSSAGNYSFIGPLNPNENPAEGPSDVIQGDPTLIDRPVAATAGYGKVILESNFVQSRWTTIDKTVGGDTHSLYEYAGTDNKEPRLVAVDGGLGSTELIGVCGATLGAGVAGESLNAYNALSSDGKKVFFTVAPISACNEAPAPEEAEIYERDDGSLSSAKTTHVSVDECTQACGSEESGKNFEGASEDGSRVFFTSTQKLTNNAVDGTSSGNAAEGKGCGRTAPTEPEGGCNLYEYASGHLKLVAAGEVLGVAGVAEDGSRLYFVKRTEESSEAEGPVEHDNLYLYEPGTRKTTYIATLSKRDSQDWAREFSRRPVEVVGSSGRFLLFASSTKGITPDDVSEVTQLFEYKAEGEGESAELVRVTKGEAGFNQDGNGVNVGIEPSSVASVAAHLGALSDFKTTTNRLNVSTDGHTVIFETRGELSPRATSSSERCSNLYEFHSDNLLSTGVVSLLPAGQSNQLYKGVTCGAEFQAIDAIGNNVLLTTVDSLIPADLDGGQRDIYDAHVGGGIAAESTVIGACSGVTQCEGLASAPTAISGAGSGSDAGEAPLVASPSSHKIVTRKVLSKRVKAKRVKAKMCRRGFVEKHGRCAKRSTRARKSSKKERV